MDGSLSRVEAMTSASLKLAVFDLDFTVWDAGGVWCDCLCPPFRRESGHVVDANGDRVSVYEGIEDALDFFERAEIPLGIASRTTQPGWAKELLELLGLHARFEWDEIYPSSKVRHFNRLQEATGLAFTEMLFFDDEQRNIEEVGAMGVEAIHVPSGFHSGLLEEGLARFGLSSRI